MQLIKDNAMDIETMLGICFCRQHLVKAVGRLIEDVYKRQVHLPSKFFQRKINRPKPPIGGVLLQLRLKACDIHLVILPLLSKPQTIPTWLSPG